MHSILIKAGPITIYSYGFLLMLAFLVGTGLATRVARRHKIPSETVLDLVAYILIAAIVGARLVYVGLQWGYFRDHLGEIPKIWTGGLSYHGGLAAAILVGAWFCWQRRISFRMMADILTPSVPLGYAIARVGCFLNGCCYGAPTSLPWACQFHDPPVTGPLTPPSHPTQLYASLINLGIFAIVWQIARRKTADGQVFFSYLALYSVYRFGIEFLRKGYTAEVMLLGLTQAQVASLLMLAVSLALLVRATRSTHRGEAVTEAGPREKAEAVPVTAPRAAVPRGGAAVERAKKGAALPSRATPAGGSPAKLADKKG